MFKFFNMKVWATPSLDCMSQYAISTFYNTWYRAHDTHRWSNIIHEFSISPPMCIHLTTSTLLPGKSINILKTKKLSLDYSGNLLGWTIFVLKWSLSTLIISIESIPSHTKCFGPNTKLWQFEKTIRNFVMVFHFIFFFLIWTWNIFAIFCLQCLLLILVCIFRSRCDV